MRLINTETLALEDFIGNRVPQYAILSHTWEDEEVTFREFEELSKPQDEWTRKEEAVAKKSGFVKIKQAAQIALAEDLHYIWVDTCCIDKSSSAELSEAINSMFSWYKRATVCYAYLFDVPDCTAMEIRSTDWIPRTEDDQRFMWIRSAVPAHKFFHSRWFTRGWTLQELIAPAKVLFYSMHWNLIDAKSGLLDQIFVATSIDSHVLITGDLSTSSLAMRMSWASFRKTTRIEDMAYCLLGIFGVNMPLLYGEEGNAFLRLQEEIVSKTADQTIFAWKARDLGQADSYSSFRGLFAKSPAEFPYYQRRFQPKSLVPTTPSSMTNMGYNAHLHLIPIAHLPDNLLTEASQLVTVEPHDEYIAILECQYLNGKGRPAILLKRLSSDGRQFARLQSDQLYCIVNQDWEKLKTSKRSKFLNIHQPESIFVKHVPEIPEEYNSKRIGAFFINQMAGDLEGSLKIWSKYSQWKAGERLIRMPFQPQLSNGLVGVLLFPDYQVPFSVYFGMHKEKRVPSILIREGCTVEESRWAVNYDDGTRPQTSFQRERYFWKDTIKISRNNEIKKFGVAVNGRIGVVDETLTYVLSLYCEWE